MRPIILVDTGPIVAFLHKDEHNHAWAAQQFGTLPLPFLTCEAVLTEAAYILDRSGLAPETVFDLVTSGGVSIRFGMEEEAEALKELMARYRNVPMALADACLVRMAERYPHSTVLTLDSDFHIYRRHRREVISVISPGIAPQ